MRANPTLRNVIVVVVALALVGSVLIYALPRGDSAGNGRFTGTDVVATVNGEPITKDEVYEAMYAQQGRQTVESLITQRLIEQEADRRGVQVSDADVDAEIAELAERYGGKEALEGLLSQSGMTMDALRQNIRLNLLVERLLAPQIEITESDLQAYYEEHPDEFVEPEQVHARHILVEEREQAEELLAQLRNGAKFEDLAREHSVDEQSAEKGGDLGWFARGDMVAPFEEAAFGAEPGTLVGPVESPYGFHLIEVLEKRPERKLTFEEARERIHETLFNQALQEKVGPWLEELRAQADIQVKTAD